MAFLEENELIDLVFLSDVEGFDRKTRDIVLADDNLKQLIRSPSSDRVFG